MAGLFMPVIARCRGIAGAGKTSDAMEVIDKVRRAGFSLQQIGFITMTRVARREASQRASDLFGVSIDDLERFGWFRTAHSACHRLLGVQKGQMIGSDAESKRWLNDSVGEVVLSGDIGDDAPTEQFKGFTRPAIALRIWDLSRSLMRPYADVYQRCESCGGLPTRTPIDQDYAEDIVKKYEAAKQNDDRLDFTDLLLRYIGKQMTLDGVEDCGSPGPLPPVPVWIIDEHQDASLLLDLAQKRMTSEATYLYIYGDPFQSVFGFSGASPKNFLGWAVAKERLLLKSWRCAAAILEHGRRILSCMDGWNKDEPAWEPRCEGGSVEAAGQGWEEEVVAATPSLVLARTNESASKMGASLSRIGVPWRYYKHNSGYCRPNAIKCWNLVERLKANLVISPSDWLTFLSECPSSVSGHCDVLEKGTKTRFKKASDFNETTIHKGNVYQYGPTEKLLDMLDSGRWAELIEGVERVRDAIKIYGKEIVENPPVVVSTIHGSKGAQAEHVFLHTGMPYPVQKSITEDDEALDEERRLYYVGATRARDRLVLVRDRKGVNFEDAFTGV